MFPLDFCDFSPLNEKIPIRDWTVTEAFTYMSLVFWCEKTINVMKKNWRHKTNQNFVRMTLNKVTLVRLGICHAIYITRFRHWLYTWKRPGPEVIKLLSCSTRLSMKFFLLINVKMPTIVGILTIMSRKNSTLSLSEPKESRTAWYFYTYEHLKFHAQLSWAWKKFYNLGACFRILLSFLVNIHSKRW